MSDFNTALGQSDLGIRFYVELQGINLRLFDGPVPTDAEGGTWADTASKGRTVSNKASLLDVADGIEDIGPWVSRATSESKASGMTLTVQDDRAGTLLGLFAREKASGAVANLSAAFGYDTASGSPLAMAVDDTGGWASAGLVHFGTECIYYAKKTSGNLTGITAANPAVITLDADHGLDTGA